MRRRPRAAAALLLAICLLVYAARPFTGAATPGLPPRAPGSGGLRPLAEYTTPVYLPASGEARVSWQPPAVRLARGTMSLGAAFDAAVAAALGYYTEALPALPCFAVTDIRSEGDVQLVSVVGLENDDPEQGWNIEQGRWFGLVLLAPAKQGGWQGALQGTPAFSRLLTGVQLTGCAYCPAAAADWLERGCTQRARPAAARNARRSADIPLEARHLDAVRLGRAPQRLSRVYAVVAGGRLYL